MLQDDFILGDGAVSLLRQASRCGRGGERRRAAHPSSVTFYKFLADFAAENQPAV